MVTFSEKYDKVLKLVEKEGITKAIDNLMGLMYLDSMVNVITQTPELQEDLHVHIQTLIQAMLDFDYGAEYQEFEVAYI